MSTYRPPEARPEIQAFAAVLEARLQAHEDRGRTLPDVEADVISRLFELIHDARDAVNSRRSASVSASDIALLAMSLIRLDGKFDASAARKDSTRIIDGRRHAIRDSSHKHAVVSVDKCMLWGAILEADFEVTDEKLQECLPAVKQAFDTLHAFGVKVGKIQIANGFVKVFPVEGEEDPRQADIAIPVNPEL